MNDDWKSGIGRIAASPRWVTPAASAIRSWIAVVTVHHATADYRAEDGTDDRADAVTRSSCGTATVLPLAARARVRIGR